MIARIWHGWTTPANADAYHQLLEREVFPGIRGRGIGGLRAMQILRRTEGDEVAFLTVLWFDQEDDIRRFVGDDPERAFVPPAARALLSRFDERVAHFHLVGGDPPPVADPA